MAQTFPAGLATTNSARRTSTRSWSDIVKSCGLSVIKESVLVSPSIEINPLIADQDTKSSVHTEGANASVYEFSGQVDKGTARASGHPKELHEIDVFKHAVSGDLTYSLSNYMLPGKRGSWQCFCRGEVVMMRGNYGWLAVYGCVDHPDATKHEGHIYVHKRDVVAGEVLVEGDPVCFYLYADSQGLGAEYCYREVTCGFDELVNSMDRGPGGICFQRTTPEVEQFHGANTEATMPAWFGGAKRVGAAAFVNLNPEAAEFHISQKISCERVCSMNPHARVFDPSAPLHDGTGSEADDEQGGGSSSFEFLDSSDNEITSCSSLAEPEDAVFWHEDLQAVVMNAPWRSKRGLKFSIGGSGYSSSSTHDADSSGSEFYTPAIGTNLPLSWVQPPPGLSLFD